MHILYIKEEIRHMVSVIVQHGDALSKEENPDRPLSAPGREQAQRLSRFLEVIKWVPSRVIHSGKLRAAETAEILGEGTGCTRIEVVEFLNPKDDPEQLVRLLGERDENILVVGHMPFVNEFAKRICQTGADEFMDITNVSPIMVTSGNEGLLLDTYIKNSYL